MFSNRSAYLMLNMTHVMRRLMNIFGYCTSKCSDELQSALDLTISRLWEGSWAPDALIEDAEKGIYTDPTKLRAIHHHGKKYNVDAPFIVDPSPQRTPVLFQAGTSRLETSSASSIEEP